MNLCPAAIGTAYFSTDCLLSPASPSSPGQAVTLTPPPPDSAQQLFEVSVAPLGDAVLDPVTNRQLVNSNTN